MALRWKWNWNNKIFVIGQLNSLFDRLQAISIIRKSREIISFTIQELARAFRFIQLLARSNLSFLITDNRIVSYSENQRREVIKKICRFPSTLRVWSIFWILKSKISTSAKWIFIFLFSCFPSLYFLFESIWSSACTACQFSNRVFCSTLALFRDAYFFDRVA